MRITLDLEQDFLRWLLRDLAMHLLMMIRCSRGVRRVLSVVAFQPDIRQ